MICDREAGRAALDEVAARDLAVRPGGSSVVRNGKVDLLALRERHVDDVLGLDEAQRPRELGVGRRDRGDRRVREPAVGRLLHDDVPRLLLVPREQHRVIVGERHPLAIRQDAVRRDAAVRIGSGRREAMAVVRGRRRREAAQRSESRVGVLIVAERVRRGTCGKRAVAAATRALLAARLGPENVELIAAVGRDLRVVRRGREAGRAARVDVAVTADLDQRLGLVALRIRRNGRRECEALRAR